MFFFLMIRRPPRSTRTDTLFPYTTLFRAMPDGMLAGARPGSGNFSIAITGKAAHAGRNPEEGRNAIVAAADLTLRLAAAADPEIRRSEERRGGKECVRTCSTRWSAYH